MTTVTVYSATKLSATNIKVVEAYAKKVFGTATVKYALDSSIIAGVRLVSLDKQVELSLSDLLDNLGLSL